MIVIDGVNVVVTVGVAPCVVLTDGVGVIDGDPDGVIERVGVIDAVIVGVTC